ncbi:MAG TPA: hypothetical protein PLV59_00335 [Candidatus Dojkabacteria bacterium]|nr:hypothetical protein [Candidatus Dojkabacteria bacterium]
MINTSQTTNMAVSQGWEDVRKNWAVPKGIDQQFVSDSIPPVHDIVETYSERVITPALEPKEYFNEQKLEDSDDLFDIELQDISRMDKNAIIAENPEIKRHIKGMFKTFDTKDFKASFNGRYLRVNYEVLGGDTVDVVFDVKGKSSNAKGVSIPKILQRGQGGNTFDVTSLMKSGDLYYHKAHWFAYVLNPATPLTIANTDTKDVYLRDAAFWKVNAGGTKGINTPAGALAHEAIHMDVHAKNPELINRRVKFILQRMMLSGVTIASTLLAIGVNPWFMLPAVVAHVASYVSSRNKDSWIGDGYYANIVDESSAYFSQMVLVDYLARKGFSMTTFGDLKDGNQAYMDHAYGYQPFTWTIIDKVRGFDAGSNSNKKNMAGSSAVALPLAA